MTRGQVKLLSSIRLRNISTSKDTSILDGYIYQGVADLYNKFNLSIKSEVITVIENKYVYELNSNDALLLLDVYNQDGKRLMPSDILDDENIWRYKLVNYKSFLFNTDKWLKTSFPNKDKLVSIYKASAPRPVDDDSELGLPDSFMEALLLYISWHITSGVSSNATIQGRYGKTEYQVLKDAYTQACMELEMQGYKVNLNTETLAIQVKGFV